MIKFRIWDNQFKTLVKQSCSLHCESFPLLGLDGTVYSGVTAMDGDHEVDTVVKEPDPLYAKRRKSRVEVKNKYTVQRFTGLTDCTGTDLYEGDILKIPNGEEAIVSWCQAGCWMIVFEDGDGVTLMEIEVERCKITGIIGDRAR